MGKTPIYGLGYLEPNQDLSEELDLDELRFRAIDTQTYALYQIFGNGIIEYLVVRVLYLGKPLKLPHMKMLPCQSSQQASLVLQFGFM